MKAVLKTMQNKKNGIPEEILPLFEAFVHKVNSVCCSFPKTEPARARSHLILWIGRRTSHGN